MAKIKSMIQKEERRLMVNINDLREFDASLTDRCVDLRSSRERIWEDLRSKTA